MNIATNLEGRLRNTALPMNSGMLPLYEAVSNSIHAIEDAGLSADKGRIDIHLIRDGQRGIDFGGSGRRSGPEVKSDIVGFEVVDNGVGFNDENMESFRTLDSDYKAARGGRGVGRLLWLKAFKYVRVESTFVGDGGTLCRRAFRFDVQRGVFDPTKVETGNGRRQTVVHLAEFSKRYRKASPKGAKAIAKSLLEHCLWYFVRPAGAPKIRIVDGNETILLDEIYEQHMVASARTESTVLKGTSFELIHVRLSASSPRKHGIVFCATNRLVTRENISGKVPGLLGNLHDESGDFVYECYVSSPLLDESVRAERTGFDMQEEPLELFTDSELSLREIREEVLERVEKFLAKYLEEKRRLGKKRISDFVSQKAPRYRPILGRIPEKELAVDPEIKDKDLELILHEHLAKIERKMLAEGHDVMEPRAGEVAADYRRRMQEYLEIAKDVKKSDLANYVFHRRVILDLLAKAIQRGEDGKYAREDLIHNLIMPMGCASEDIHSDMCNLWLIDERLTFHDYLASDKTLKSMPIMDSDDTKEPDIVALNVFDNPFLFSNTQNLPLASIVIVELKRPMRNDAASGSDKNPVEQALDYLDRIRNGKVQTRTGRQIPESNSIPAFCYAICDITPTIKKQCGILGLTPTHDHLGYFGYNPNYGAYLEVLSFDRLVNAAGERNRAFFDKLGLPANEL